MKSKFLRIPTAITEYFDGDRDAFVEVATSQALLLFVWLVEQPVRIQKSGSHAAEETDLSELQLLYVNGKHPISPSSAYRLLGRGEGQLIGSVRGRFPDRSTGLRTRFIDSSEWIDEQDCVMWLVGGHDLIERKPIALLENECFVSRGHLLRAVASHFEMREEEPGHKWPWGGYETGLLKHLAAAADRYWRNFDPADPSTAETKETIVGWLVEKCGVSRRSADAIDTILRAENLPKGPRR